MRRAAIAGLALLAACADPKDAAGWAERAASRNRLDEKLAALARARTAPGDRHAAVAPLAVVLGQSPRAREGAAVILGEFGDPAAVPPLLAALAASSGGGEEGSAAPAIAAALGALHAREAVPALVTLLSSRDGFAQIAAADALGEIGDPAAVPPLASLADDPQAEPFLVKRALLALGRIGDPRAVPVLVRMLYAERPGVSFFPEAAFALSELGAPAAAPLVAVLDGRDAPLAAWAADHRVAPAALRAKAAQLLGDLGGPDAEGALLGALGYADRDPNAQLLVRVFAAESLGRLRARAAVAPIAALLGRERNPDARDRYADALARIGDPAALPALRAAAVTGTLEERDGSLDALSRIGGEPERPVIEAARSSCGSDCAALERKALDGMVARLDAARACGDRLECWRGKLADPLPQVRDRAAGELGRRGASADLAPLGQAVARPVESDPDLAARYQAILALDAVTRRAPPGKAGLPVADLLERTAAADRGRTLTGVVDEDAKRLAARLRRAAGATAPPAASGAAHQP